MKLYRSRACAAWDRGRQASGAKGRVRRRRGARGQGEAHAYSPSRARGTPTTHAWGNSQCRDQRGEYGGRRLAYHRSPPAETPGHHRAASPPARRARGTRYTAPAEAHASTRWRGQQLCRSPWSQEDASHDRAYSTSRVRGTRPREGAYGGLSRWERVSQTPRLLGVKHHPALRHTFRRDDQL
jgi:hypothetical protein